MQSLTAMAQSPGPDAVWSQAWGIGVIWLRSLSRNQVGEYGLSITMVTTVGLTAVMSLTSIGKPVKPP